MGWPVHPTCRVFQRRVEHAFLTWLASGEDAPYGFRYAETAKNEPAQQFLADIAFGPAEGDIVRFDAASFAERHRQDLALFELSTP